MIELEPVEPKNHFFPFFFEILSHGRNMEKTHFRFTWFKPPINAICLYPFVTVTVIGISVAPFLRTWTALKIACGTGLSVILGPSEVSG